MMNQTPGDPTRRGFIDSAAEARADEAAWHQQLMREKGEAEANARLAELERYGGGFFAQSTR